MSEPMKKMKKCGWMGGNAMMESQGILCDGCGAAVAVDVFRKKNLCRDCLCPPLTDQQVEDFIATTCGIGYIIDNTYNGEQYYTHQHRTYKRKTRRPYVRSSR